jgi:hypothetical protein
MELLKVRGTKLVRDTRSGAIINQDKTGLEEYLAKRRGMQSQKEEINKVKSDITEMKKDMADIKDLLQKLLEKGSNG